MGQFRIQKNQAWSNRLYELMNKKFEQDNGRKPSARNERSMASRAEWLWNSSCNGWVNMGEWTTERFKTTMLSGDYVEIMGNKEQQLSSTAQASRNPNLKQTWWRSSLLYMVICCGQRLNQVEFGTMAPRRWSLSWRKSKEEILV
jgi:hypothetical protein